MDVRFVHSIDVYTRLARMTAERIIEAAAAGLRSAATHSGHRCINNINTGIDGTGVSVDSIAAAFMCVQMYRQVNSVFESTDKAVRRLRF